MKPILYPINYCLELVKDFKTKELCLLHLDKLNVFYESLYAINTRKKRNKMYRERVGLLPYEKSGLYYYIENTRGYVEEYFSKQSN